MGDTWKSIWNKKTAENYSINMNSTKDIFLSLKYAMGVGKIGSGGTITFEDFYNQFLINLKELSFSLDSDFTPNSFFDLGCGTGCYLYLLETINKSYILGGSDYSEPFINLAKKTLPSIEDLTYSDAADLDTEKKYDCVFSRSIFQYFPNESYAEEVVNRMIQKSNHSVGLFYIHDLAKKEEFIAYRRSTIEDYDKKYAGINHMFYSKNFFAEIAEQNNCSVKFSKTPIKNYWNSPYTYDVYFFKNIY